MGNVAHQKIKDNLFILENFLTRHEEKTKERKNNMEKKVTVLTEGTLAGILLKKDSEPKYFKLNNILNYFEIILNSKLDFEQAMIKLYDMDEPYKGLKNMALSIQENNEQKWDRNISSRDITNDLLKKLYEYYSWMEREEEGYVFMIPKCLDDINRHYWESGFIEVKEHIIQKHLSGEHIIVQARKKGIYYPSDFFVIDLRDGVQKAVLNRENQGILPPMFNDNNMKIAIINFTSSVIETLNEFEKSLYRTVGNGEFY